VQLLLATEKQEQGKAPPNKKNWTSWRRWAAAVESNDPKRIGAFFVDDFLFVGPAASFRIGSSTWKTSVPYAQIDSVRIGDRTIHIYAGAARREQPGHGQGQYGDRDISVALPVH